MPRRNKKKQKSQLSKNAKKCGHGVKTFKPTPEVLEEDEHLEESPMICTKDNDNDFKSSPSTGGKAFLRKISGGENLTKRLTARGLMNLFTKPQSWQEVPGAQARLARVKANIPKLN